MLQAFPHEEFPMYWLHKDWAMGKNTPQFPHAQSVGTFAMQASKTLIEDSIIHSWISNWLLKNLTQCFMLIFRPCIPT